MPSVVVLRPDVDARLGVAVLVRCEIRVVLKIRGPVLVVHRAVVIVIPFAADSPHKLGPGAWVLALSGHPHVRPVVIKGDVE